MVKMWRFFLVSIFVHGLLAFSVKQLIQGSQQKTQQVFSVTLLTTACKNNETVNTAPLKISKSKPLKKQIATKQSIAQLSTSTSYVVYNPSPNYPDIAKDKGQEGSFSVKMKVNTSGNVEDIQITTIKGDKRFFDDELIATMKTWKFSPGSKETFFEVPISFQLDKHS